LDCPPPFHQDPDNHALIEMQQIGSRARELEPVEWQPRVMIFVPISNLWSIAMLGREANEDIEEWVTHFDGWLLIVGDKTYQIYNYLSIWRELPKVGTIHLLWWKRETIWTLRTG
jgi:hypothetical protein